VTTFSETALPALIFSVPATHPKGDVPALGRLTVTEAQAIDQAWVAYGMETNDDYTHTDSTGSGALFYEAETRTALGGSATAAGPSGASGAGSNVMRSASLPVEYISILSTQATGGGAHLSHVGSFRVYARVQAPTTNTGTVTIGLEYASGDFRRFTRNSVTTIDSTWEGTWRLVDLGIVTIEKLRIGTQRWEGRVIAQSTIIGDKIDVDCLMFFPTMTSGVASAVLQIPALASVTARDDFAQTAGALTGKTLPVGGTWVGAGDLDDFNVTGSGTVQRTVGSDASNSAGRFAIAGTSVLTSSFAAFDIGSTVSGQQATRMGIILRYTDTSNYLFVGSDATSTFRIIKVVAGTPTTIASVNLVDVFADLVVALLALIAGGSVSAWVDANGRVVGRLDFTNAGYSQVALAGAYDSALATGGALASGKVGFYDAFSGGATPTRTYDNFIAAPYTADAAMFASQSMEFRHDGVVREDSAGVIWPSVSLFEGDMLRVPVTGREGRSVRFIVKGSRNVPPLMPDPAIDDISATLAVTPRFLSVPAPA
jgi:hypothetical protein